MSARPLTLVLPYYENPGQLLRQYTRLARMPEDIRRNLALIVADDGSPERPATPPKEDLGLCGFKLFRVLVDVRWNWLTCRNIGAHHAETEWLLFTDIDHELPEATARRIIFRKLDANNVYRFNRVTAPKMTPYKIHPNTWLMTKAMFDKIGGYDEVFSGAYGSDGEFRDRVNEVATEVIILPEIVIRIPREVVPDASTTRYLRKQPEDGDMVRAARAKIAARKPGEGPIRLSFPFRRIA